MSDEELEAMSAVYGALESLKDGDARARVLRWVTDKLEINGVQTNLGGDAAAADGTPSAFESVGDVFEAASPSTGPERAMAAAYWLQQIEGRSGGWGGREVNDLLKNMGHPLANVTKTLDLLRKRDPQLVMQVGKSGRSHQARKTYKLTTAGVRSVEDMFTHSRPEAE